MDIMTVKSEKWEMAIVAEGRDNGLWLPDQSTLPYIPATCPLGLFRRELQPFAVFYEGMSLKNLISYLSLKGPRHAESCDNNQTGK